MTSLATNSLAASLQDYDFASYAELNGTPGLEIVTVSTNWDKESITFPAIHLPQVLDALLSLKHELTGKRG